MCRFGCVPIRECGEMSTKTCVVCRLGACDQLSYFKAVQQPRGFLLCRDVSSEGQHGGGSYRQTTKVNGSHDGPLV
jgi:hypothetical protein